MVEGIFFVLGATPRASELLRPSEDQRGPGAALALQPTRRPGWGRVWKSDPGRAWLCVEAE